MVVTVMAITAFQRHRAATVVPVSTAIQSFLPIVVEPFFLREQWSDATFGGVPIVAGLLISLVGTVLVSRTTAVGKLAAGPKPGKRRRRG